MAEVTPYWRLGHVSVWAEEISDGSSGQFPGWAWLWLLACPLPKYQTLVLVYDAVGTALSWPFCKPSTSRHLWSVPVSRTGLAPAHLAVVEEREVWPVEGSGGATPMTASTP